jgi:serine phosphatase RsbU (regulator of sigma subunit)
MYGEDRLRTLLLAAPGISGAELSDRILHEVQVHSGQSQFEDDVCLLVIEAR